MASLTRWTWVWATSGRWWRTGKPGHGVTRSRTQLSDWTTTKPPPVKCFISAILFWWTECGRCDTIYGIYDAMHGSWIQGMKRMLPLLAHYPYLSACLFLFSLSFSLSPFTHFERGQSLCHGILKTYSEEAPRDGKESPWPIAVISLPAMSVHLKSII